MNKASKNFPLISFVFTSLFLTSLLAYSYLNTNKILPHDSHDAHIVTQDEGIDHAHKHRHAENEKEHSHKHIDLVSFSEIIINKISYIEFNPIESNPTVHFDNNIKPYDSFILEILKPPIIA